MSSEAGIVLLGAVTGWVAGLVTAVAGPAFTARRAERAWYRDQRVAVYADALTYAAWTQRFLESLDVEGNRPPGPAPVDLRALTARMTLLASTQSGKLWRELADLHEIWDWNWDINGDQPDPKEQMQMYNLVTTRLPAALRADVEPGGRQRWEPRMWRRQTP